MKKYAFKPYKENFPTLFSLEKTRIAKHVKNHLALELAIEHVGSTAIPNLGGKGIIDMAIATNKKDIDTLSNELKNLGYLFREIWSSPERLFFRADLPDTQEKIRRYHIHLTFAESSEWKGLIAFRDYLRANPDEAKRYAELKKNAAQEAKEDGSMYRQLKKPMFQEVLKKYKI